jgi:hypothetical protein
LADRGRRLGRCGWEVANIMKIVSWNVNGLRAIAKKLPSSLGAFFRDLGADIVCLQETKISEKLLTDDLTQIPGYEAFFATCKMKQGYSGVWYPFDLFYIYIFIKSNRNGIQLIDYLYKFKFVINFIYKYFKDICSK